MQKVVCLIQARTNSSRLPAKVLLPIGGVPLIVLAARRAANKGIEVKVVTSVENSDDYLCSILSEYSISYYRGSLINTLERFVSAVEDADDDTIIIRLTGDNVVPDGDFLQEMVCAFRQKSSQYISSSGEGTGLPYGFSVEVTELQHLKEANNNTVSAFDLEHVTPYVKRKFGDNLYCKYSNLSLERKRCTIDTLDDYLYMAQVFQKITDPINESAFKIVEQLE